MTDTPSTLDKTMLDAVRYIIEKSIQNVDVVNVIIKESENRETAIPVWVFDGVKKRVEATQDLNLKKARQLFSLMGDVIGTRISARRAIVVDQKVYLIDSLSPFILNATPQKDYEEERQEALAKLTKREKQILGIIEETIEP